jgi:hypothetical protein
MSNSRDNPTNFPKNIFVKLSRLLNRPHVFDHYCHCFRWSQHFLRSAEHLRPHCDVLLLHGGRYGSQVSEIHLVEEIPYCLPNGKWANQNYWLSVYIKQRSSHSGVVPNLSFLKTIISQQYQRSRLVISFCWFCLETFVVIILVRDIVLLLYSPPCFIVSCDVLNSENKDLYR